MCNTCSHSRLVIEPSVSTRRCDLCCGGSWQHTTSSSSVSCRVKSDRLHLNSSEEHEGCRGSRKMKSIDEEEDEVGVRR